MGSSIMPEEAKQLLMEAWAYCDEEDKSTEFMLQYMSDMSGVEYENVVQFVMDTTDKERKIWYDSRR